MVIEVIHHPKRVKPILLRALDMGFGIFPNIPGAI